MNILTWITSIWGYGLWRCIGRSWGVYDGAENYGQKYRILSDIVRKFMPGVSLLEEMETYDLGGAIDIWIPKNVYYQEHREEFEKIRALGDKLWFYICCYPGGSYLNRLWDMPRHLLPAG